MTGMWSEDVRDERKSIWGEEKGESEAQEGKGVWEGRRQRPKRTEAGEGQGSEWRRQKVTCLH